MVSEEVDDFVERVDLINLSQDFSFEYYSYLPLELQLYPLQFLTFQELLPLSTVCKDWYSYIVRQFLGRFIRINPICDEVPSERVCHATVAYKNKLLVFGGHIPAVQGDYISDIRDDLWEYSIDTHQWKRVGKLLSVTEMMPILWNNKMLIFGGFCNGWRRSAYMLEIDCETGLGGMMDQTELAAVAARSAYSSVQYDDYIYVYGGWDGRESMNDLNRWHIKSGSWEALPVKGVTPPYVRSHAAVVYKNSMYIYGGFGKETFLTDLYRYDFETGEWSIVPAKGPSPSQRSRVKGVIYGHRMFLVGGWNRRQLLNDIWTFNFENLTWNKLNVEGMPDGIAQYSLTIYNDVLYVFGGATTAGASNNLYGFRLFDR